MDHKGFFAAVSLGALITSPAGAQVLAPASQAHAINPDTQLKLTFGAAPGVGKSGQVRIYDASNDRLVDTLDLSIPAGPTASATTPQPPYLATPYSYDGPRHTNADTRPGTPSAGAAVLPTPYQLTIIGGFTDGFHFYPITVDGNTATIHPHNNLLQYGHAYYVQIDPGVLTGFGGVSGKAWRFTTKAKSLAPKTGATRITVSADGRGDFNTVQGAVDSLPDHGKTRVTIFIKNGVYEEIVYFRNKDNVTFRGENEDKTIVRYANNEVLNPHPSNIGTNEWPGTFPSRRAAFMADHSNGVHFVNMTIATTSPGQAEGLLINGQHDILDHVNISGAGDALQINGPTYIVDSTVFGTGDTILGRGPTFFERTTLKSTRVFMWIRNTDANHGNVFKDCTFIGTTEPTTLARSPKNRNSTYPYAEAVLIDAKLGNIAPEGWGEADKGGKVHFWEYNSRNLDGTPVDMSHRAPWARQLDKDKDAKLIADYRKPSFVLGGWAPKLEKEK